MRDQKVMRTGMRNKEFILCGLSNEVLAKERRFNISTLVKDRIIENILDEVDQRAKDSSFVWVIWTHYVRFDL